MKIEPLKRLLSGFLSAFQHNSNADKIEAAFENTISRDGSTPNNMEANLDLGHNRIINVGAPVDPNDAVRLQDVIDLQAGDLVISTAWDDIQDKPDTFPPDVHAHSIADVVGLNEFVEDTIGSKIVAGSNVTISYNDTTGETTVSASGSVSTAWGDLTGVPSTFTPSAHNHVSADVTDLQETVEDYIGAAITAGTNITVSYNDATGKTTIDSTGGGGSGVISLETFGGNGNGVFDNITAFAAAEASSYKRIYLEGIYKTTGNISSLSYSKYYGPGKILFGTTYRPAKYVNILTKPSSGSGVDLAFFFSGDTSKITAEHYRFGTSTTPLRVGLSEQYYDSVTMPYFTVVQSWQGYGGLTAFTTNSISTGATTVNLDLSASGTTHGLDSGTVFVFAAGQDSTTVYHTATSSGVSGSTLSFSPAVPSSTTIPSGSAVYIGKRTSNGIWHSRATHTGGGDFFVHNAIISNEYKPTTGQTHVFNGSTAAAFGGEIDCIYDGQYMTATEFKIASTADAAGIGHVLNMDRNNDTGARGAFWIGYLSKSEGSKYVNAGYSLIGKHTIGIDAVLGDFGTNRAAMAMKLGDRIHFNNSTTPRGQYSLNGDTFPGSPMYIGSDTVSGVKVVEIFNGIYRLRLQENGGLTTNASFTTGANILAGGTIQTSGGIVYLNAAQTSRIDASDGVNIKVYKNGALVQTW